MANWAETRPPIASISLLTSDSRSGRSLSVFRPSSVSRLSRMYVAIVSPVQMCQHYRGVMRAAVWNDKGSLDVVDRPVPEPKPGWVRVAVGAVGICGTDLHFFSGAFPSPAGLLPGHEIGGTIELLGEGADADPALAPGQAVAVEPLVTCGHCPHCRTGDYTRCASRMLLGVTGRGGMAEFMTAPATTLYPLPAGLTASDGALVE